MSAPSGGGSSNPLVEKLILYVGAPVLAYGLVMAVIDDATKRIDRGIDKTSAWIDRTEAKVGNWFTGDSSSGSLPERPGGVADQVCSGAAESSATFAAIAMSRSGVVRPEYGAALNAIEKMPGHASAAYDSIGPEVHGDRAYGMYQIMGVNIPIWSKQILGVELDPTVFLQNHEFQDIIAYSMMVDLWKKHENFRDVASVWHSGKPYNDETKKLMDFSTSNEDYVLGAETFFNANLATCQAGTTIASGAVFPTDCRKKTSNFEIRTDPTDPSKTETHLALDVGGCPEDSKNYAGMAGTVEFADTAGSCGQEVKIENKNLNGHHVEMVYCHMSQLLVSKNQKVAAGQPIGVTGSTGKSTGKHCHFEVFVDGQGIDAEDWFRMVGIKPPYV